VALNDFIEPAVTDPEPVIKVKPPAGRTGISICCVNFCPSAFTVAVMIATPMPLSAFTLNKATSSAPDFRLAVAEFLPETVAGPEAVS